MDLKKIKWQYCINRKEPLLFRSLSHAPRTYFNGLKGMPWQAKYTLHFDEGDFFINPDDFTQFRAVSSKGGLKYFYNFIKNLIFYVRKLDRLTSEMEKINFAQLSDDKSFFYLKKYIDAALRAHTFLLPFPLSDKLLSDKILSLLPEASAEQKQEWLKILTFPEKENEHTKEGKAFYNLAADNLKLTGKKLNKHLKKFGWIGGRYLWEESWTENDIKERINYFLSQKKDTAAEYKKLNNVRKEARSAAARLIKKSNIKKTSELYKYILLAKEFSYLRTWRTDIIYRGFWRTKNLLREIAKQIGLKEANDIRLLTFEEIIKSVENKKLSIPAAEISERKKFYVCALFEEKLAVLSGDGWKQKLKFFLEDTKKEIKGVTAFKGKIKGRVKIVMTNSDIAKVKNGDIMVATMTFPHFIPAMEKAAAFITDEGGILCHAAIVAREMGKPCIIGTKNATRILKDGDFVEVDAERGIVKILKRNKI